MEKATIVTAPGPLNASSSSRFIAIWPINIQGLLGRTTATLNQPVVWSSLVVAVLLCGALASIYYRNGQPGNVPIAAVGGDRAVAVVSSTSDVQWSKEITPKSVGATIWRNEPLKIDSGIVELQMKLGATLLIAGPAELSIDDDNSATLRRGKLAAKVPTQAIGLTIRTSTWNVVDLGTEFGVEVTTEGVAVEVFAGALDLHAVGSSATPTTPPMRLVAGQSAVRADAASGIVVPLEPGSRPFAGMPMLALASLHQPQLMNLAFGRITTQSSEYGVTGKSEPRTADKAVDGRLSGFTHTARDDRSAWWQVDLQQLATIESVVLYNRADGTAAGRLRDITITILADDGRTVVAASEMLNVDNHLGGGRADFNVGPVAIVWRPASAGASPPVGRFLRVARRAVPSNFDSPLQIHDAEVLSLGEVRVMGRSLERSVAAPTRRQSTNTLLGPEGKPKSLAVQGARYERGCAYFLGSDLHLSWVTAYGMCSPDTGPMKWPN
jgi:NedA-like, galactose-binding domain